MVCFFIYMYFLFVNNNNVVCQKELLLVFLKKFKNLFLIILTSFIMPISILAYSDYIFAGGESVGISISSKGVMVVGLYPVDGRYIARDAGIKIGDMIVSLNNRSVVSIDDMTREISNCSDSVLIGYIRNDKLYSTNLSLVKDDNNVFKTGLYVKDQIKGIGTLTFIDPETKMFGALGHEIIEKSSGQILEVRDGKIFSSSVTNVEPSRNGVPGEKNAVISDDAIGKVFENTNKGIFGEYTGILPNKKVFKVASIDDISTGEAKILTVLDNQDIKEYKIEILKVSDSNEKVKNLLFEITDDDLLDVTGGIVQGMSGSPIIQNDFIGAVTHVVVDSPTKGYGIFIKNMLEEAHN